MTQRHRLGYIVVLVIALALVVAYVHKRDLRGKYEAYQESEKKVEASEHELSDLKSKLEKEEERLENLETDPLEIEAAIRRISHAVRKDEKVFRVEAVPEPESGQAREPRAPPASDE